MYTDLSTNSWYNVELREGNYWSDYSGEDLNGDGVGDTNIPWEGLDNFPLVQLRDLEPPRPIARLDNTAFKGQATIFNADESYDDAGISEYSWNLGDGATENGREVSHIYTETGEYTVTLTVVDLAGKSESDTLRVNVVDPPLTLTWWIVIVGMTAGGILIASLVFWKSRFAKKRK